MSSNMPSSNIPTSNSPLHGPDAVIGHLDRAVKSLFGGACADAKRPSPGDSVSSDLSPGEKHTAARLMRVNHCGEVCAQALYQGQYFSARTERTAADMAKAMDEENDHLAWCEKRLRELDTHPSYLNPLWYAGSFALGFVAGLAGDKYNLGFLAATENEVCHHLDEHLQLIPENDHKSRAILQQMRIDEGMHASSALSKGGLEFATPITRLMRVISKLMTKSTYWI